MQFLAKSKIDNKAKPFIKWAGGKTQLLGTYQKYYPEGLKNGEIDTYIEPMVGGGAVLFDILQNYHIEKAIICDINEVLINTYLSIKYDVQALIKQLETLENYYLSLESEKRKKFYYEIRHRYNTTKINDHNALEKVMYFIFLNKTCFNGLYRVNARGEFNVPMGSYKNPKIADRENLILVNGLLQNVEIYGGDYRTCLEYVNNSTFVYIDPPYRPLNNTSSFTSYNAHDFNDSEQEKLALFFYELDKIGAKVMLSNSDPKNTDENDNFFDNLYGKFNINRVQAKRMINSKGNARGDISEIVVANY